MGLPLLLRDAVGAGERFLREGENGFAHRAGDVDDMYRSLVAFVALPADRAGKPITPANTACS